MITVRLEMTRKHIKLVGDKMREGTSEAGGVQTSAQRERCKLRRPVRADTLANPSSDSWRHPDRSTVSSRVIRCKALAPSSPTSTHPARLRRRRSGKAASASTASLVSFAHPDKSTQWRREEAALGGGRSSRPVTCEDRVVKRPFSSP